VIDVIMLTKNSNKPYFRRVLKAVKENIPVHHFIVVDGYSTDGAFEAVKGSSDPESRLSELLERLATLDC